MVFQNTRVPISISVGDTLNPEPIHVCEKDPKELCKKFVEELERRGEKIRKAVRKEFIPEYFWTIPPNRKIKNEEWCDQVSVLGFNSGSYDVNLIKEHFVEKMVENNANIKSQQSHVHGHAKVPIP